MNKGRFTIPTDESFVEGTKIIAEKWGADAVRDCDGTKLPENASQFGKVYNTYFIVRGDNEWARLHPEEAQRILLCPGALCGYTKKSGTFSEMYEYGDRQEQSRLYPESRGTENADKCKGMFFFQSE